MAKEVMAKVAVETAQAVMVRVVEATDLAAMATAAVATVKVARARAAEAMDLAAEMEKVAAEMEAVVMAKVEVVTANHWTHQSSSWCSSCTPQSSDLPSSSGRRWRACLHHSPRPPRTLLRSSCQPATQCLAERAAHAPVMQHSAQSWRSPTRSSRAPSRSSSATPMPLSLCTAPLPPPPQRPEALARPSSMTRSPPARMFRLSGRPAH